MNSNFCACG